MWKFLILNLLIFYTVGAVNVLPDVPEKEWVSVSVKALLDEHAEEVQEIFATDRCEEGCLKKNRVYEFPWLPGYLVKKDRSRIFGADILRSIIQQNDLDLLGVPDKKVYLLPESPELEGFLVVVEKLVPDPEPKPFSLCQVQQLWALIKKSGYVDLHNENYLRLPNDKIMIIDTELYFFSSDLNRGLSRFILSHEFKMFEEEAFKFLLQKFAKFLKKQKYCSTYQAMPHLENFTPYFSETSTYPQIYDAMRTWITVQENIFEWDYLGFFEENYPKPKIS